MLDPVVLALPDPQLVIEVGSRLRTAASESRFEDLSTEEQVIVEVYVLEAEVNNGGFDQFFMNSSGDQALATPLALDAIGASNAAVIMRKAMAEFGAAGPDPDREERIKQVEILGEPSVQRWDALDQLFYEYPDDLAALLATYIRNHAHAIHHIEPVEPDA
jgi:Domain of unknown function (DUF4375)